MRSFLKPRYVWHLSSSLHLEGVCFNWTRPVRGSCVSCEMCFDRPKLRATNPSCPLCTGNLQRMMNRLLSRARSHLPRCTYETPSITHAIPMSCFSCHHSSFPSVAATAATSTSQLFILASCYFPIVGSLGHSSSRPRCWCTNR